MVMNLVFSKQVAMWLMLVICIKYIQKITLCEHMALSECVLLHERAHTAWSSSNAKCVILKTSSNTTYADPFITDRPLIDKLYSIYAHLRYYTEKLNAWGYPSFSLHFLFIWWNTVYLRLNVYVSNCLIMPSRVCDFVLCVVSVVPNFF